MMCFEYININFMDIEKPITEFSLEMMNRTGLEQLKNDPTDIFLIEQS